VGCAVWQEVDPAGRPADGKRVVPGFGALFEGRGAARFARSSIPLATLRKGCPPTRGSPRAIIGSVWRRGTGLRNTGSRHAQ